MIEIRLNSFRPGELPFISRSDKVRLIVGSSIKVVLDRMEFLIVDCVACGESGEGFIYGAILEGFEYKVGICSECGYVQGLIIGGEDWGI